jgi:zinc protease
MEQLDLDDTQAFYDLYYAPNNAVLVVAGDVETDNVLALAKKYYGVIPAEDQLPERIRPQEPPQRAERRITYVDPRVSQPFLIRNYLAPERDPGAQEEAAALVYLAELLGGSSFTSDLGQALQFDTQTAIYTNASYSGSSLDTTAFSFAVVPAEGVTLSAAEAAMDQVIADFMESEINVTRMDSIRTQLRAAQVYALDDVSGIARRYGAALTQSLTVEDVQAWPDILQAVTPGDIKAVAAKVLNRDQSVTGWVVPSEEEAM